MNTNKRAFHEQVADSLIKQLKQGTAPWQKPWKPGDPLLTLPNNPSTNKRYRGINTVHLMSAGRSDPRWMTYKQATNLGAQVRSGEKGTQVQYWKFTEEVPKKDNNGKPVLDNDGKQIKQQVKLERPRAFYATVFNAEQIDNLPKLEIKAPDWEPVERAEKILKASNVVIKHGQNDKAFYRSSSDEIHLPHKEQFATPENYYATALHELAHSTGHETRLNRDLGNPFGSEAYAKEELRAEIASMIMGSELGIGHDPEQHAAYVGSWIKVLEDDPKEIFRAAADAEKIQDYVLALPQTREFVQEQDNIDKPVQVTGPNQISTTRQDALSPDLATVTTQNIESFNGLTADMSSNDVDSIRLVADARTFYQNNSIEKQEFEQVAIDKMDINIPADWTGRVHLPANATDAGEKTESFGVYAQQDDRTYVLLKNVSTEQEAEQLADKLKLIDAAAEKNEYEKAVKFSRINEERVRQDPLSTDEDISAAKEDRKLAEAVAMHKVQDLRNEINKDTDNEHGQEEVIQDNYATNEPDDTEEKEDFYAQAYGLTPEEVAILNNADRKLIPIPSYDDVKEMHDSEPELLNEYWAMAQGQYQEQTDFLKNAQEVQLDNSERQYLVVPYAEKDEAKAVGASWDNDAKSWYVGEKADIQALQRWMPENVSNQQEPNIAPEVEFADLLRSNGCIVDGNHPVMDGTKQRIKVEGDKPTEKSGFYVGHLDGNPAGYIINNRTKDETRWKAKGYTLNDGQKAELSAQAAINQQNRKAVKHENQLKVADAIKDLLAIAPLADANHSYLQEKNARPGDLKIVPDNADDLPKDSIIKVGRDWQESKALREESPDSIVLTAGDLLLPAQDTDGQTWSVQTIQPSGVKFFATGSKKESNFHVVDSENKGLAALDAAPAIVISEGYATADTLSSALDCPVVAAFDSGNLPKVAQALHEKYPQKPIIIAGDDDRNQESVNTKNPGREKALEAADLVNGEAVFPVFAPNEQVTQKLSDFNDLANKSTLGLEGVKRQVGSVVTRASEQAKAEKLERLVEQKQQDKKQKQALVR